MTNLNTLKKKDAVSKPQKYSTRRRAVSILGVQVPDWVDMVTALGEEAPQGLLAARSSGQRPALPSVSGSGQVQRQDEPLAYEDVLEQKSRQEGQLQ